MGLLLSLLIASFILNAVILIPFINLLYRLKLQRKKQKTRDAFDTPTPIFDSLHQKKVGTPVGGGLLLIVTTTTLFLLSFPLMYYFWIPITSVYMTKIGSEIKILLFTFISFACIGCYDDFRKVFLVSESNFFGLRLKHKLILEIILSLVIAFWLYTELEISIIHIPFLGVWHLGILFIPFAVFVILAFANAFNITDGLDGLSSGILLIALVAFWVISRAILDTPLSLFITIWIGGLLAFLYFNVYPARLFLGDVGALAFGATFAVIGLLLGKTFSLIVIGGFFVAEVSSSFIQLVSKKFRKKKIFRVAPVHLWLQDRGWHESTIVFRAWLATIVLAIIGLWLALLA